LLLALFLQEFPLFVLELLEFLVLFQLGQAPFPLLLALGDCGRQSCTKHPQQERGKSDSHCCLLGRAREPCRRTVLRARLAVRVRARQRARTQVCRITPEGAWFESTVPSVAGLAKKPAFERALTRPVTFGGESLVAQRL